MCVSMPSLAKRSCSTPGCKNTCISGHCSTCQRTTSEARGTTSTRGYDTEHQRLRVLAFERDHWTCIDCGWRPTVVVECDDCGLPEPPTTVILATLVQAYKAKERHLHGDHIVAVDTRPDLAHLLSNYATRCDDCHRIKTAREGGRSYAGKPTMADTVPAHGDDYTTDPR